MASQAVSGSRMILGGYAAIGAGAVTMLGLHVVTGLDPVHTVISEYAFEADGWLLPVSLTLFAVAATVIAVLLARRGEDRRAALLVGLWGLCMLLIGAFPTDEPGVPLSMSGGIHRYAAFVAFLTMPVAGLLLARRRASGPCARWVRLLSLASLGVLVTVVVPYVVRMFGIDLTNEEIPAGVTQRLLVSFEVTVLAMLAVMERVRLTPPGRALEAVGGPEVSVTDGPEVSAVGGLKLSAVDGPEVSAVGGSKLLAVDGPEASAVGGSELLAVGGPVVSAVDRSV